jgi:hypothetical protein
VTAPAEVARRELAAAVAAASPPAHFNPADPAVRVEPGPVQSTTGRAESPSVSSGIEARVAVARPQRSALAELVEPAGPLQSIAAPQPIEESELPHVAAEAPRSKAPAASPAPVIAAASARELTGPRDAPLARFDVGSLAEKPLDTPPSLHPLASRLARRPARATPVAYAQDNVGMQAMFTLRQGDVRREIIELVGGSDESEKAVRRGLEWLQERQHTDGRWSLHDLNPSDKQKLKKVQGQGSQQADTAATGLALLPFLGAGHTHQQGDFQPAVSAGIAWLVEHQKPDGDLFSGGGDNAHMYAHGIAAIALCEAYGMTRDPALREPAQRALDFIVAAQHKPSGGWRYQPNQAGDTSVVGWQLMALKSGEMAGLVVPAATLELTAKWLDSVEGTGAQVGRFGYQGRNGNPAMTAEALLCRQFLGSRRSEPGMQAGAAYLLEHVPRQGHETSYYWYYATQVMYHMQGSHWETWNEHLRDLLVKTQERSGAESGTWNPKDQWEERGGRLYATCLRLLMLEVYYRHLPLYRQLGD